ncbi:MAG: flagellar M-ring protein FliF [Oscillospiraceae bacterium]|nr:flagellar M-ring protein FliF [Oscillospiraceae bacterium]
MSEKVKDFGTKFKDFFGKLSKKTLIILGVVLAALIIGAIIIVSALNNKPYSILFTNLSSEEASTIMNYLEENGARDYRLQNNDTILVPRDQEVALKAQLLMAGYPKSGFSYGAYFNNVSALSTESERNRAFLIALEEKMRDVIRCFDGVKDASVSISEGDQRTYVLQESVVEAEAAVQVTMADGELLTDEQANAIRTLVSRAVKGLSIENVAISDTAGNLYIDNAQVSGDKATALKLAMENQLNSQIRTNVMQVLTPFFGEDNVRVSVRTTVDVDQAKGHDIQYTLPEYAQDGSTDGRGIIGSEVNSTVIVRGGEGGTGGVVGAGPNSDINTYLENQYQPTGTEQELSGSNQRDYKVDETYREWDGLGAGTVTDCTLAVSINATTANAVDTALIRDHVAKAAGIGAYETETMTPQEYLESKISVVAMPFYDPTQPPAPGPDGEEDNTLFGLPNWVVYAALAGLALFVLILILVLVLVGKKKKKKALEAAQQEEQALREAQAAEQLAAAAAAAEFFGDTHDAAEAVPSGADVMDLRTERSMELRKEIRQFADENPEIAAQMVKTWLKGGEENG